MSDYLIIGGGVIGLLLARELAAAGAVVSVVEKGECFREASWAGGGIVSPLYPWRYSPAVSALAFRAQTAFPDLANALMAETGIDPELTRTGLLMLDADDETEALAWAALNDKNLSKVSPAFFLSREPGLAQNFESGLWMPDIANIRNPRLGKALLQSLRLKKSVTIRERCSVVALQPDAEHRIEHVSLIHEGVPQKLYADNVVVTAGAWSAGVLRDLGLQLPVAPVKGQMLLFQSTERLLNSIVLTKGRYLIPRRDNYILAGSTLEHTEFDKSTTDEALRSLLSSAVGLLPALGKSVLCQQWAGLRPGAPQGIPWIGQVPGFQNLYVNAGHFRNGLVLAPASAELMADMLLGRTPAIDPAPYNPLLRVSLLGVD